jgi:hypothetical protein
MKFWLIIFLVIFLGACKKSSSDVFVFQKGVFSGGTDCSKWLIKKEDNALFFPTNLDSFNIHPESEMPVLFSYRLDTLGTTCVVTSIHLLSIRERKN